MAGLLFGERVNAYLVVCGEGVGYQWQRRSKLWLVGLLCEDEVRCRSRREECWGGGGIGQGGYLYSSKQASKQGRRAID